MFKRAKVLGLITGVHIAANGPFLTHLQFADDTMVFCNASRDEVLNVKNILLFFEAVSGLKINFHKSVVSGVGLSHAELMAFADCLGCKSQTLPMKYLGLPLGANPRKKSTWKPVIDNFQKKLAMWKRRHISFGGRIALIKSVLANLPIYFMSLFNMPSCVVKELEKLQSRFLWGGGELQKKVNLVSWSKISICKERGGLGIKNLKLMNECLLLKWWWRFGVEKDALWRKVICCRYKLDVFSWLPSVESGTASIVWRDICLAGQRDGNLSAIFLANAKIVVGNGRTTRFWHDIWVGGLSLQSAFPSIFRISVQKIALVADIANEEGGISVSSLVTRRRLYSWEQGEWNRLVDLLGCMTINPLRPDHLSWVDNQPNSFSVRSLYSCKKS